MQTQTLASPPWVGNTPAKARSPEVELEAFGAEPGNVGVRGRAGRAAVFDGAGPDAAGDAGAKSVGPDDEAGMELAAACHRGLAAATPVTRPVASVSVPVTDTPVCTDAPAFSAAASRMASST